MLTSGGNAAVGTLQHEGVRYDSNSLTDAQMREVLEIPAPAEAPASEAEPIEAPETPAPAEESAPADTAPNIQKDAAADKAPKAKKNPQERIDKITFEREEAKREAAKERQAREEAERRYTSEFQSLRAELDSLKRGPQSKEQPRTPENADPEPKLEDFADQADPYAAWMRATAKYDARQEWHAQQAKAREAYQQHQIQQREQERHHAERQRLNGWAQRMEAAFAKAPELRETVENMPVLPRPMMDVIIDSDIPDQIIQHFLQHPEEQSRIAALPNPKQQFREVARIEYQLEQAAALVTGSAAPAKPKTSAHPPVSPVSGAHAAPPRSGEPGPDASYEEHKAYWNSVEAEQRRSRR